MKAERRKLTKLERRALSFMLKKLRLYIAKVGNRVELRLEEDPKAELFGLRAFPEEGALCTWSTFHARACNEHEIIKWLLNDIASFKMYFNLPGHYYSQKAFNCMIDRNSNFMNPFCKKTLEEIAIEMDLEENG